GDFRLENMGTLRPQLARDLRDTGLGLGYPTAERAKGFLLEKAQFQSRDSISHFALRLAFCKANEAREWLLKQEQRLFVLRFEGSNLGASWQAFVESVGIRAQRFEERSDGPSLQMLQKCTAGAKTWRDGRPEFEQTFYEMPFTEVPPAFIAGRRVVLKKGKAFVPATSLKLIVAKKFKDLLSLSLDVAFQGLHLALADPRVGLFLRQLQEMGLQLVLPMRSSSQQESGEQLSLGNFEEMLSRSMPPCMRRLVERQREARKHLKHAGRLQLRPFLKACGFSFEDSVSWWKQELCRDPTIDAQKFDKNYMYDIEHAYGKKGHNQGQNCCGCPKLIGLPGETVGQVHGCPFKQMDVESLRQQLQRWQVPSAWRPMCWLLFSVFWVL
ncbi:Prim2, partial [Symbiodinium natans]